MSATLSHRQVSRLTLLWSLVALGTLVYGLLVESAFGVPGHVLAALALLLGTGVNAAREWHADNRNPAVGWLVMGLGWVILTTGTAPRLVGGALVALGGGALLVDSVERFRS